MEINILFFSVLRELAARDGLIMELSQGATLGDAVSEVFRQFPNLAAWDGRLLLAVNSEYADRERVLQSGDEVALMPPVQGG